MADLATLALHVILLTVSGGRATDVDLALVVRNVTQFCSPWLRPVLEQNSSVTVQVDLQVLSVLDVNEKEEKVKLHVLITQRWRDELVSWKQSSYGGLSKFTVPSSQVWTPDVTIREALSDERQHAESRVCVEASGWMSRVETVLVTLKCDLSLLLFPFDKQNCNLTLGTHLHTAQELVLAVHRSISSKVRQHGEWELMGMETYSYTHTHRLQQYSTIAFQVGLGRSSVFYVLNLMVPCTLLILLDVVSFAIPVECEERIPFKVTLLLGYTVFLLLTDDLLPPFRDHTPILGVYLVVCLVLLCLSVGESVMLLTLGQPDCPTTGTPLERLALRLCPHLLLLTEGDHKQHSAHRSLRRSFSSTDCGAGFGVCGCCCVTGMLGEEISEELGRLNRSSRERRDRVRLMEALDSLCFHIYVSLLLMVLLSPGLLWALKILAR